MEQRRFLDRPLLVVPLVRHLFGRPLTAHAVGVVGMEERRLCMQCQSRNRCRSTREALRPALERP